MHKIKRFPIYTILFFFLICQLTILNYIRVFGKSPDLVLICVIFFGLFFGWRLGLESGLISGFLIDIFAFDIFGMNAFIFGLVGLLSGALNTKFFKESKTTQFFLVLFFVCLSRCIHLISFSIFSKSQGMGLFNYLTGVALPNGVYTALISIVIFSKLISFFLPKEGEELL